MSETILSVIRRHPILAATAAIITASAIPAYQDYQVFLSYGPGGPPYNPIGWIFSRFIVTPWAQEPLHTQMYDQRIENGENTSYLSFPGGQLPHREGERPTIGSHAVPHRQTNQIPSDEIKQKFVADFDAFASKNTHLIQMVPSQFERHSDSMCLVDDIRRSPDAVQSKGEFAHIHATGDHSSHIILTPADAKKVIEAGWGQRHPFSGFSRLGGATKRVIDIPSTYMLIYAPRNQHEIDVVMEIVKASLRHMSLDAKVIS